VDLARGRGGLPLYVQLAAELRARIAAGELRPGHRLPGEPVLVDRFGVSRSTVAKALELLEDDGLIRREQGRGTFVQPPRLRRPLPELTGFSEHVGELGHQPGSRLVSSRHRVVDGKDPLAAPFGDRREVLVVRRLRLVDAEPVGLHRLILPADLADRIGLTPTRLGDDRLSIYALFAEHGVRLDRAEEQLAARAATRDEAALLGVRVGEPLMLVRRLSYDDAGELVEAVDAQYIGTRYDYRIDLVRTTAPGRSPARIQREEPSHDPTAQARHSAGRIRVAARRVRG
jgi:GntR family transcriptional regulator